MNNSVIILSSIILFFVIFVNTQTNTTFKIAIVNDEFLKYQYQDNLICNGTLWWANWVNKRGGLVYNGNSHLVEVITLDSSTPNPKLIETRVIEAYQDMIARYPINLIVSPATSTRTGAAIKVSENKTIINIAGAAQSDSLFVKNNSYIMSTHTTAFDYPVGILNLLIEKGAKNYAMLMRPDNVNIVVGTRAQNYLASKGITFIKKVWVNSTATDTAQLGTDLRQAISQNLMDDDIDIFIYCGVSNEFETIVTVFDQLRPSRIKSAMFMIGTSRLEPKIKSLGSTADQWLTNVRWDPELKFGVSGEYGGTTAEFADDFTQFTGGVRPTFLDAIIAGLLMGYYRAVTLAGSVDSTIIRNTMHSMDVFQTFAFPLKFGIDGQNQYPQLIPIQFQKGEGQPVTLQNLIYPADWVGVNTIVKKSVDTKKIISIAIPVGVVALVLIALATVYVRHQRQQAVSALEKTEEGERRNYKIDYSALSVGKLIGSGGFGFVYKGEYRGADVAVKKLKSKTMNKDQLEQFAKESAVMIGLRHPNILLFMGACVDPPELCIITEFCSRGSLFEIIHNDKINIPFPLVKSILEDTLKGLQFIHSSGFVHRDLKSPNLLVDKSWNIKISDFGLSCLKSNSNSEAQMSLLWTSPEVLNNEKDCYSDKSDIYAFAITVWELMARKVPFDNMNAAAVTPAVVKGVRPPISSEWNPAICELLTKCWDPNPNARLTIREARTLVEGIYIDPNFEIGSSSAIAKYTDRAPPPYGTVTFVNTIIHKSSQLWEHDPRVMMRSIIMHNELIRTHTDKLVGYEVKNDGESFMIAFPDTVQAINFCLRVQSELVNLEWPEQLLSHSAAKREFDSEGNVLYKGFCVKMGIHIANPTNNKNIDTGKMDYVGPGVKTAYKLAQKAGRGLIMTDPEVYAKAMASVQRVDAFTMRSVGPSSLSKHSDPIHLYELMPKSLGERVSSIGDDQLVLDEETDSGDGSKIQFDFPPIKDRWVIKYEDVGFGEKIGAGSFGEVRAGTYKGKRVAIKEFMKQKVKDSTTLELRAESAYLSMLQHENVLVFIGMCLQEPHLCMVTEFMEKGSLANILYNPATATQLNWNIKKQMIMDMAQGMAYLHSKSIIHRDIKSSNMLVTGNWRVKIADFGFSRMKADNQTMTQCGTVAWTAPEIFDGSHYSEQADVYSFGIILWEMIFSKKPWTNVHSMKVIQMVSIGSRPSIDNLPSLVPPSIISLMQSCWAHEADERPTFEEIVEEIQNIN